MSRAALIHDVDSARSSAKQQSSSVRVSHPGDSFEMEAERVADTVSRGGRVSGWSLSASGFDGIYRQPDPQPQAPASAGDVAGKVAEAILATPEGKKALATVTAIATTPAGLVVTGAAAIGVVAAMDRAKKPLPAQAPAIPLDFIKPGLSVKIGYNGPVNKPTDGSITFSFSPKAAEKKPAQTPTEKLRSENAAMAADQEKFRAGLRTPGGLGPVKSAEDRMFDKWQMDKLAAIGNLGKSKVTAPVAGATPAAAAPVTAPAPAEKKPEPAPAPAQTPKAEEKKKEEVPVQRKAEPSGPVTTGSVDVDSVLRSPGRPLDRATRREMESRIGYDFSNVRLHTDSRAADSAKSLSAQAYTVGSNVVFAPGRFAPHATEGRRLLAHELTHVVQQTSSPQRAHPAVRPAPSHVQRFSAMDIPGISWLLGKVRGLRGYKLVCTVFGHDLFDDTQAYERNATTITKGILELFPGGDKIFQKLQDAGKAIETAYNWLADQFTQRKLTVEGIEDVLQRAVAAFKAHPLDGVDDVLKIVQEPINQLIDLAGVVARKVLDFILEGVISTFGETGKKVWAFFQRAGGVISKIAANPLQFGQNLLKAVGEGFKNFFANIWDHLSKGVKTWFYEELHLPNDIKMPEDFTLGSMLKLLLRVLGLTWEHWRPQLVEKLQPIGGETVVYFFEKSAEIFMRIRKEGFGAIKEMIVEKANSIFDSFVDNIKNWIAKEFIERGLKLIAELSNPVGEIVKVVESIIDTVTFIIEKAKQLAELINTVVNALSDIADGNTGPAAKKVEDTLAKSIPLLLRFIAGQFGLSGIGKSIREIIDKIRAPIDKVIGKVVDVLVDKVKPLWEAGKAAFMSKIESIKQWWTKPKKFSHAGEEHEITLGGDPNHPDITIHSRENPLGQYLDDVHANSAQKAEIKAAAKLIKWTQGPAEKLSDDEQGNKNFENLRKLLDGLDSVKDRPKAAFTFSGTNSFGCGKKADAFLSSNHDVGSKPEGSDPQIMKLVREGFPKDRYLKGHLLSMRLGGKGEWENMMPVTNRANQLMEGGVEGKLISAISHGKKYYHYTVMTEYDETPLPTPATAQDAKSRLKKISGTVQNAIPDPANPKVLIDDPKTKGPTDENENALEITRKEVRATIASGESET